MKNTVIAPLFGMTSQGIGKWKKENRFIILFIEKYLSEEDIKEFIENRSIKKFDLINKMSVDEIINLKNFKEQLIKDEITVIEKRLAKLKNDLNVEKGLVS